MDLDKWLSRAKTPWDAFPDTVGAKSDAESVGLAAALRHDNVTLATGYRATRLLAHPQGRITGVEVERAGRREVLSAPIVVLSAGAVQSAALLLASADQHRPTGLANSSDQVGRNFMNHNCSAVLAVHPFRKNDAVYQKTLMINDFYLHGGENDTPLGNVQLLGKISGPILAASSPLPGPLARWVAGRSVDFYAMSEDLPNPESRVTLENGQIKLDWKRSNWEAHLALVSRLKSVLRKAGFPLVLSSAFDRRTPKQTLHTANTSDHGDDYRAMARAVRAGGAMDEDTAYVEAVGSARMMASLQFMGLPLPQDRLGGTLRYQTDHDEVGRATSCGPRTSRLMVKVLAEEAIRLQVPIYNQTTAVKILAAEEGGVRKVVGILVSRGADRSDANPLGLSIFRCNVLVLAAGGPGELYRDSVYPNSCFGSLGLALEAGIDLVNLTESQFGIGTRREGFPWNLSGTYVQAIPHIFSVDGEGREHHFLAEFYRTTQELASNVFRKGYQWPFHSTRMLGFGSSLVDLAIYRESAAGRRVFMDFNRNPLPVEGDEPFALDRLDDDVRRYLGNAGATQTLPIDRLAHMNPLAIELYRRYKIDLATKPLEFAVNNQHMNGGVMVDVWGRSNLPGCYAIGEAAGTHGVTRPGGAALNAGQVFGTRAAEHIAAMGNARSAPSDDPEGIARREFADLQRVVRADSPISVKAVRTAVQARMSDSAGIICDPDGVSAALEDARALNSEIRKAGISHGHAAEAVRAAQWQQMALASEAVLSALDHYVSDGGGSRGARAICDPAGDAAPSVRSGVLEEYRFRKERQEHRAEQIIVRLDGTEMKISSRANRTFDESEKSFFERDWPDWLTGGIYAR